MLGVPLRLRRFKPNPMNLIWLIPAEGSLDNYELRIMNEELVESYLSFFIHDC